VNIVLIGLIMMAILLSATWRLGVEFDVDGTHVALQNILRDAGLIVIALASLWLTNNEHRANGFTFEPIREVAILFAGIFVTIIPVMAVLQAGPKGVFAWLLYAATAHDGTPHEAAYFWLSGVLSGFLDNAPTYLVFFELASGDAGRDLDGRGLHGRTQLHRQCTEPDGLCHRQRTGRAHAELFWLRPVGSLRASAAVPDPHAAADLADSQAVLTRHPACLSFLAEG
jgi:hypothetical protein